jgi:hypothetical protein
MSFQLIASYQIAIVGAVVGAVVGLILAAWRARTIETNPALTRWDLWVTIPLLLAAVGGHIVLVPQMPQQNQVLFSLYTAAVIVVVIVAFAGLSIWRVGAVLFPVVSIVGYFYYAIPARSADYVGLGLKVVEVAVIIAALVPLAMPERMRRGRRMVA